jgi:hypothetical protein
MENHEGVAESPEVVYRGTQYKFHQRPEGEPAAFRYRVVPHRDPAMYLSRAAAPLIRGKNPKKCLSRRQDRCTLTVRCPAVFSGKVIPEIPARENDNSGQAVSSACHLRPLKHNVVRN